MYLFLNSHPKINLPHFSTLYPVLSEDWFFSLLGTLIMWLGKEMKEEEEEVGRPGGWREEQNRRKIQIRTYL